MLIEDKLAKEIASSLLQIKAIKLNTQNPFTWTSGIRSPIYCDNRKSLSYPALRTKIKASLAAGILDNFPGVEVIAGVATAGIPHGALVADQLDLPFVYVRSQPKKHGLTNSIEGELRSGQRLVVVEDLISTAKSSLQAVATLREAGANILGLAAIFSYGFDAAAEDLKASDCPYITLSDYEILIDLAIQQAYIKPEEEDLLRTWRTSPENWLKTIK